LPKSSQQYAHSPASNLWRQNHGNFLLGVIGVILVIGAMILAYRQLRFQRPRFPVVIRQAAQQQPLEAMSEEGGPRRVVIVRVIGAASDEGTMRIAAYARGTDFNDPDGNVAVASWPIQAGIAEGRLNLPEDFQELAFAAFHDANDNGVLDRNLLGIPSERYGFSGNARGLAGPPDFADALVPITEEPILISIR
jgi:uncharacterized protein (DUF2141 family)